MVYGYVYSYWTPVVEFSKLLCLYSGSCLDFKERHIKHKSDCYNINSNAHNMFFYRYLRANNIKFDTLLLKYEAKVLLHGITKKERAIELHQVEELFRRRLNPITNKNSAYTGLTPKEYSREREKKPKRKAYKKIYNASEEMKTKRNQYAKEHKEEFKKWGKEKCMCECGKTFTRWHKSSHIRTKHHQNYILNNSRNAQQEIATKETSTKTS